ncbi:MAG: aldolase [Proteobacteria bacterium]|nr:aldolase [Pseudomonadota bacterium]
MNGLELSKALKAGRRIYGTLITSPSPHLPPQLKSIGLDYVFIDTEHIPLGDHDLAWMCQTYRALNLVPIVRIPEPDPYRACKVLDGGACGIVAPYIESVAEVQALRGAVKLRPLKGKKLANALDGTAVPTEPLASYLREGSEERLLFINIESVPAVENLDAILATPGVDAVQIGPHDLSVSMGIPEQYALPEFDKMVRLIITKARAANVGVGIHFWDSLQQEIEWAKCGANIFLHSADVLLFTKALHKDLKEAREALGDQQEEDEHKVEAI